MGLCFVCIHSLLAKERLTIQFILDGENGQRDEHSLEGRNKINQICTMAEHDNMKEHA
jgi:hypothetical protein